MLVLLYQSFIISNDLGKITFASIIIYNLGWIYAFSETSKTSALSAYQSQIGKNLCIYAEYWHHN